MPTYVQATRLRKGNLIKLGNELYRLLELHHLTGQFGADGVDARHQSDDRLLERATRQAPFDPGGGDAGAEWFREHESVARPRPGVR